MLDTRPSTTGPIRSVAAAMTIATRLSWLSVRANTGPPRIVRISPNELRAAATTRISRAIASIGIDADKVVLRPPLRGEKQAALPRGREEGTKAIRAGGYGHLCHGWYEKVAPGVSDELERLKGERFGRLDRLGSRTERFIPICTAVVTEPVARSSRSLRVRQLKRSKSGLASTG